MKHLVDKNRGSKKSMVIEKKRIYEWLIISQSYLQSAIMLGRILQCKLISNEGFSPQTERKLFAKLDVNIDEIYGDYPQTPDYLIYPILFNFKHGVELYLKVIMGISNGAFRKSHNLITLLGEIDKSLLSKDLSEMITKYAYSRLLLNGNIRLDEMNEFERYPQGSPYDDLELDYEVDKNGLKEPNAAGDLNNLITRMKVGSDVVQLINNKKMTELLHDMEHMMKNLRALSLTILKT